MPTVADRLAAARARLIAAGLSADDAAFDAEVLSRHLLGWDRAGLLTHRHEPEPVGFPGPFEELIERRAAREPVAQIIGHREFWGLDFEVTRDVLVPRPETELIIEEALAFATTHPIQDAIDVGTGSGCIAVALATELPEVRVIATDLSMAAIDVARRNATSHGVASRVRFQLTNVLTDIDKPADLIVSNPPYVPASMTPHLQKEVVAYEPHAALFGGESGMEVIDTLLRQAPSRLKDGGRLIMEFGYGQRDDVVQLAAATGWTIVRVRDDLQGIPRTIVLTRHGQP